MKKNTILVTGCVGFIGYHLIIKLSQYYNILGIDNINDYYDVKLKKDRLQILNKIESFKFYKIDILSKEELSNLFKKNDIEFVVHLAAQAGVRYSLSNPQNYIDVNITGFLNILESCKNSKIKKLIYASSSSVYGSNIDLPFRESQKTDSQLSMYGVSKKTNELMAHSYSKLYNIKTIGLRFFTVYGPWGRPDMALFKFTKSILENRSINVFNNGMHSRSFTYVDDIVNCIHLLTKKINSIENIYNIINIGGNQSIKLMDYINCIEYNLGKKAKVKFLPMQIGDVENTESNVDILFDLINYKPKISIDEGIPKFINWYKSYYGIKK